MSFEWRQLSPFDFFSELRVFPRVALLMGFVLWLVGLFQAVSFHNPTVVLGTSLILFAVACHYFGHSRGLSGVCCTLLSLFCFLWFLQVGYGDRAPRWVNGFWQAAASLIW